jgi:holo-[acyl-carrier protein] synthase
VDLRVGIDTVSVASVSDALAAHGDRYLERVYTARERADCKGDPERLAARFAAKEATLKALRVGEGEVPWTAIGVEKAESGAVDLVLTGPAAARAGQAMLSVSLTHEAGLASAVVIFLSSGQAPHSR